YHFVLILQDLEGYWYSISPSNFRFSTEYNASEVVCFTNLRDTLKRILIKDNLGEIDNLNDLEHFIQHNWERNPELLSKRDKLRLEFYLDSEGFIDGPTRNIELF